MKNNFKNITFIAIAVLLLASPTIGLAKENDKNKQNKAEKHQKEQSRNDDHDEEKKDRKNSNKNKNINNTCLRAYGHFFSVGWNKKNQISDSDRAYFADNCYLPFGISKKFHGNNASTTPDTIAPIITNLVTNPGTVRAEIRWNTNEQSDSVVFWNTSNTIDTTNTAVNRVSNPRFTKNHQIILKNLIPDTTYYMIVRSKDFAGNATLSAMTSFRTRIASTTDTQYPVISSVVTTVSTSTINVGWKTNENTTDRLYYSTNLPVTINASSTAYVSNASSTKNHGLSIVDLSSNTTYYIVIESTDTAGNVTTSATFSAKTNSLPIITDVTAPVISSIVTIPGASTTTISWITDELSTSRVYFSTTTPLIITSSSTQSILNSSLVINHSIQISDLATSTIYYFIVQSTDSSGNTRTSSEISATTLVN